MRKLRNKDPDQLSFDFSIVIEDVFVLADLANIKQMLPQLYITQQEDVAFAERRFEENKGVMFTNGTGTGKTFVGLGIIKRFYVQDKKNILIVVPTDQKSIDWIEEALHLNIIISKIKDIYDCGKNVTVTTYANFYQNEALLKREFDLIIYDESHYLSQNAAGTHTVYLRKHKILANLPSVAKIKALMYAGPRPQQDDVDYYNKRRDWNERKLIETQNIVDRTKVVFLSATPFAYHKSVDYADGTLWDINENVIDKDESNSYNDGGNWGKFMIENFGYQMKYNKVTIPDSGVDVNLLERAFFEKQKELGVMSTRQLILDYDYSRDFVIVDSEIGEFINEGMNLFYKKEFSDRYPILSYFGAKKYNYNFVNQLLECIKAQEIHKRIQKHLDLNRKVVVFHSYNHSTIPHPFHFDLDKISNADEKHMIFKGNKELDRFSYEYPHLVDMDLSSLKNTRKAIKDKFPQAREFNGTIPKKRRSSFIEEFQTDNSMTDIIIVQEKAGKEGISLHDKTGVHQRASINLGLPTAPTTAIQLEGRTYRSGLKSNAIYEYITVQTDFEKIAFATKIAERSKTVENLAMGNLARDLETSFKEGYVNASQFDPHEGQGVGSKENDRQIQEISEFDKAKTYYFSTRKKTSKTKAREGLDYFATPEPLGYAIVKWLNPKPNERGLEPSAGHGAISRFFPEFTTNTFIEPSFNLLSTMQINSKGKALNIIFEDYYDGNKHHFIAMNPPFGKGGKTAMEHVAKACNHLYWKDARLIAIIPEGGMMQKRLDRFYEDPESVFNRRNLKLTGEILLPDCVFERAGTKVRCKIIKIEVMDQSNENEYSSIDLRYIENVNELFDILETLDN